MSFLQIIGRVGREPETNQTAKGPVVNFSVAVSDGWGENEKTTWYRVAVFNEGLQAALKGEVYKGGLVAVEGNHRQNTYNDKVTEEILANRIYLVQALARSKRADAAPVGYAPNLKPAAEPTPAETAAQTIYEF